MYKRLILVFGCLFSASYIFCATIGSDSAVNRLGFQVVANGDRVANFAFLEGGFALQSTSVTATMDTYFPTTGLVDLNGGTLYLNKNFVLHNTSSFQTMGNIIGNGNTFDLAQSVTCVALGIGGCTAVLTTSALVPNSINSMSWSFDNRFLAVASNTSAGVELSIFEFTNSLLTLQASVDVSVNILSVAWHPSLYLLAIGTAADAGNPELVMYSFNPSSFALALTDSEEFGANVTAVSWHPTGGYLAVGSASTTQELSVYPVDGAGVFGTPVTVDITPDNPVNTNALSWNAGGSLLAVGNADINVYVFDTSPSLALTLNVATAVTGGVNAVSWNPAFYPMLAVGTVSSTPRLRVYQHDVSAATLTQIASSGLDATVRAASWSPDGYCLGVSKNTSAADEFFLYAFNTTPITLVSVNSFDFTTNIAALAWTPNGRYIAQGGANNLASVYATTSQLLANGQFNWSNVYTRFNNDICLNNCTIKFQGACALDGRGNTLSLSPTSTILVDSNTTLLLRDMIIRGITDRNIRCTDSTGTCTFENVEMILDGNYTFDQGRFDVLESLLIRGAGKVFTQRTGQINTILTNSVLQLDDQVTYSYDPTPVRRDGLAFSSSSSQLILNGATLHTTTTGIALQQGALVVQTTGVLAGENSTSAGAITLGNGTSSSCNQTLQFYPDAQLHIASGVVVHNNR